MRGREEGEDIFGICLRVDEWSWRKVERERCAQELPEEEHRNGEPGRRGKKRKRRVSFGLEEIECLGG